MDFFGAILFTIAFFVLGGIGFLGIYGGEILCFILAMILFFALIIMVFLKKGLKGILILFFLMIILIPVLWVADQYIDSPEYKGQRARQEQRDTRQLEQQYLKQIVGKTYNFAPNNKQYGILSGLTYERIEVSIQDEKMLTYQKGMFACSISGHSLKWIPKDVKQSGTYEYTLEKGFFGNYYIRFSSKEFKLVFDDNLNVLRIEDK